MTDLDVLPSGTVVGDCALEEVVSVGGFGLVYRGRRSSDGRPVAVKIGKAKATDLTAQQMVWQQNEVEALTRLKHPSLVEVLGYGFLDDGRLYLVMELVEGPILSEYLSQKGRLDALEATRLAQRIAEALSYCHAAKVLHLDLKPANIILVDPSQARIKVLDFGLARLTTGLKAAERGLFAGTLAYMAPEAFSSGGDAPGPKADLYALGALFYEMLSGGLPFPSSSTPQEMIELKRTGRLAPLADVVRGVPPAVCAVIQLLLESDPARRIGNAGQLAERLRSLYFETLHGKPADGARLDAGSEVGDGDVPLVGRSRELGILAETLEAVRAGQGRALLMTGDPGIGKSALTSEALERARARAPWWIGAGRCRALGELLPYSPLREALGHLTAQLLSARDARGEAAREKAGQVLTGPARELLKLVPELGRLSPAGEATHSGLARGVGAELVSQSLVELLGAVATEQPVCLAIEDMHWADAGSMAVLSRLASQPLPPRVLLLCTSRSDSLPAAETIQRLAVGALSPDENLDLLAALIGGADALALEGLLDAVPLLATGNPLVNAQIARQLQMEGYLSRKPGGGIALSERIRSSYRPPESVNAAVERGLERLDTETLKVLRIASLIDRTFRISDVASLGLFTQEQVDRALETARSFRLCTLDGDRCTFAHDTIRERLAGSLKPEEAPPIHHRIALRLEEREASFGARAYHYQRAGDAARAAAAFVEAGLEADRVHDPIGAARLLKEAFALFPRPPAATVSDDLVTRAVYELVRIACLSGNAADTLQYLELGASLVADKTPPRDLALQSAYARMYYAQGNFPKAVEYSQKCMALAKSAPELKRYQFIPLNTIGRALCGTGKFGPSVSALTEACAIAAEAGEQVEQTHTEGILCVALAYVGEYEKAREHAETCRRMSLQIGDPVRVAASYFYFSTLAEAQFRWDEGVQQTAELLAFAEQQGITGLYLCVGSVYAGRHQFHIGQLDRARHLLTNILAVSKQLGISYGRTWAHAFLGDVEFVANRREAARAAYAEGLALANAGAKDEYAAPLCLIGLAHLTAREHGQKEEVTRLADEAISRLRAQSNHSQLALAYQRYAEALDELGETAQAATWREAWRQSAERLGGKECDFWPRVTDAASPLPPKDFWRDAAATTRPEIVSRSSDPDTVIPPPTVKR
jgi:tetratricopeptide (TPR) repeat protein